MTWPRIYSDKQARRLATADRDAGEVGSTYETREGFYGTARLANGLQLVFIPKNEREIV